MIDVWGEANRILDAHADPDNVVDLAAHGVHLLAARRWRELGRPVPPVLVELEREAQVRTLAAPYYLKRVRSALDGPVLLIKGPEIACRYPDPSLRSFVDIDIYVPHNREAWKALVAAGFSTRHALPGMPLFVEAHAGPDWVPGFPRPPHETWFSRAVPSATGIEGIDTVDPATHAVLLAVHSWKHAPFRQLGDLIDIALMLNESDAGEVARLADAWGVGRIWRLTMAAVEEVLLGQAALPSYARPWTRHLRDLRDRSNLEFHSVRFFQAALVPTAAARRERFGQLLRGYLSHPGGESRAGYMRRIMHLVWRSRAGHAVTARARQDGQESTDA